MLAVLFFMNLSVAVELSPSVLRRLVNIVELFLRLRLIPILLIYFGHVTINSSQLFIPRLPSAPAKNGKQMLAVLFFYRLNLKGRSDSRLRFPEGS